MLLFKGGRCITRNFKSTPLITPTILPITKDSQRVSSLVPQFLHVLCDDCGAVWQWNIKKNNGAKKSRH